MKVRWLEELLRASDDIMISLILQIWAALLVVDSLK